MKKIFLILILFFSGCIVRPNIFIYNSMPIKIIPTLTLDLIRAGMSVLK